MEIISKNKPRLAIVSTYDDLCGIAAYTRRLVPQLEADFNIEVFDLDQLFMRAKAGKVVKLADAQIKDICQRLQDFDTVNIQLEYGTLGHNTKDILRRLKWLLDAAPRVTVTFHTILSYPPFQLQALREAAFSFELYNSYRLIADHMQAKAFRRDVYSALRKTQKEKHLSAIVHTPRDARHMQHFDGLENVTHHPLAFVPQAEAVDIRSANSWRDFHGLRDLPKDAVVLGVFGFLGVYKGAQTAIAALHQLPEKYHLAIFGGLHPHEIIPSDRPHPYVSDLMGQVGADQTLVQALANGVPEGVSVNITPPETLDLMKNPNDLSHRVHFMGSQSDPDLDRAVASVDVVVLPYMEVGQTSSGPMSLAVDMQARVVASRTGAFMQFAGYHPDRISLFEIGNHLELAQRVLEEKYRGDPVASSGYNTVTNAALYKRAILGSEQ